jgi:hypothetical protein
VLIASSIGKAAGKKYKRQVYFADPEASDYCQFVWKGHYVESGGDNT